MSLLNICGISEWITVRLAENHKKKIRSDWIAYKYVNLGCSSLICRAI